MSGKLLAVGIIFGFFLIACGLWILFGERIKGWLGVIKDQIIRLKKIDYHGPIQSIFQAFEKQTNLAMIILSALIVAPLYLIPFDRIDVGNGYGWDGWVYAYGTINFYEVARNDTTYVFDRIFPLGFLHHVLTLLRIPFSPENIILSYSILNICCVIAMAYLWSQIADELKISWKGKWLGFIGLFINYLILKQYSYFPVHTDLFGYFLALATLTVYLKRNTAAVYILMVIGSFTHPTLLYIGGIMVIFPRENMDIDKGMKTTILPYLFSIFTAMVALSYIVINLPLVSNITYRERYNQLSGILDIDRFLTVLLPIGIIIIMVHIFWGLFHLSKNSNIFNIKEYINPGQLIRFIWVGFSIWAISYFQTHFPIMPSISDESFLLQLFSLGLVHPGVFYVAHVLWFGPLVLFAYILWIPLTQTMKKFGKGLIFCAMLGVIFCLISASRRIDTFYALFLPFIIQVIDRFNWTKIKVISLGILCLIYSRFWLIIGKASTDWGLYKYSMNRGQYMSFFAYLSFIIIVGLTAYFFYDFFLERNLFPWSPKIKTMAYSILRKFETNLSTSFPARIVVVGVSIGLVFGLYYYGNLFMETTMRVIMGK